MCDTRCAKRHDRTACQDPAFVSITAFDCGGASPSIDVLNVIMPANALYVLVWSSASGGVGRWLYRIQAFAPGADVLLVCNHSHGQNLQPQTLEDVRKEALATIRSDRVGVDLALNRCRSCAE
jgi:hypothetical protein